MKLKKTKRCYVTLFIDRHCSNNLISDWSVKPVPRAATGYTRQLKIICKNLSLHELQTLTITFPLNARWNISEHEDLSHLSFEVKNVKIPYSLIFGGSKHGPVPTKFIYMMSVPTKFIYVSSTRPAL